MVDRNELGRRGETFAVEYLRAGGYRVIDRNWRCESGEIDIVAERNGETAFVEVKTRSGLGYGHPFAAISPAKLERMRRLAMLWCDASPRPVSRIRLDVIGIVWPAGSPPRLEHLERLG
ncbi:YraN family protein [Luethyella okanaganae]|uniref:UPF0102 protein ACFQB0_03895 n=1 Tax=Luethyella okanaganae TaxID=69372 RepID=A0ABW1VB17_9MICO